jgi:hypothetical protein
MKKSPGAILASMRWANAVVTEAHSAAARINGAKGGRKMACGDCGTCDACKRKSKRLLKRSAPAA